MKQSTALNILKTGKNVFLTGSAGAGKTYTINQYLHYLRARDVAVAVTASTGIASTHMNGMTIHSWAGIGILDELTSKDLTRIKRRTQLVDRMQRTQVLVIDEISMLHLKQFDMINQVLQFVKENEKPFGGVQLLVAGDFFQLPPIGNPNETNRDKFAFMSQSWLDADFQVCYLTEQHRQIISDNQATHMDNNRYFGLDLTDILNQIRRQQFTEATIPALQATEQHTLSQSRTRLYTHNINVQNINEQELANLTTPPQLYVGWGEGDEKLLESLKKSVRNTPELTLKVGAKVMFIKNNTDLNVSNGTMGTIVDFQPLILEKDDEEEINHANKSTENNNQNKQLFPVVQLNDGRRVVVDYDVWKVEDEDGEILSAYYHIPLTLAWAITIHKSQGMTLDSAEVNLSKTFEKGQGYVALSRLKQLSGLQLLGINELSLQLDPLARGADKRFIELSDELEQTFLLIDGKKLQELQQAFILKSRGTLNPQKIQAYEKRIEKQEQALKRKALLASEKNAKNDDSLGDTYLQTKALLEESLTIAEIAEMRNLAQSTIVNHIAKLQTQFNNLPIDYLRPDEQMIENVQKAYDTVKINATPDDKDEDGMLKIRPIHEFLSAKYGYNEIRLALLFVQK
ncbi:helix-turn-helix domain-containing protein [Faucicola boevrei]|uniref:helix-turn-helix domain-containing protein n=1 Tax=Faucicola boevrei TaxID=346665 RepID=UPI000381FAC0|nr:helix-turn-helix domain-containing protein [Moraxella boevrei]